MYLKMSARPMRDVKQFLQNNLIRHSSPNVPHVLLAEPERLFSRDALSNCTCKYTAIVTILLLRRLLARY